MTDRTATMSGGPLTGLSVLLAEDNVTNQLVASQMLKALGAEVEIAADGALALDILKTRAFDVLLVDIEMPRVSGLDVIRSVRSGAPPHKDAPIIALTAYAMDEHKAKILDAGADALIPKPIASIAQFGDDIARYMAEATARRGGAPAPAPAPQKRETASDVMERERKTDASGALIETLVYDGLADSVGAAQFPRVLERAEEDLRRLRDRIEMAAESGDMELMGGASHTLVSVAGAVGATRLQKQAEALNRLATIEQPKLAAQLVGDLVKELNGVLAFVRDKRGGLGS